MPDGRTESATGGVEFGARLTLTLFLSGEADDNAWVVFRYLSVSTNRNLVASFVDASASRRRYSSLSITTTQDPSFFNIFIVLNIFLHLTHIYANSFNFLPT